MLRAAITLADKHAEVPSMRVLAKKLGVEAMSLYNHVASKEDLLDGMIDLVWAEIALPSLEQEWTAAMRGRAIAIDQGLRQHQWAIGLMEGRGNPGPSNLQHHNDVLGCLRTADFSPGDAVHVMSLFDSFIYGFALQRRTLAIETPDEFAASATRQTQQAGALAERYPYLAEVVGGHVAEFGYDYTQEFAFGLDTLIRGLTQTFAGKNSRPD